MFVSLNQVGQVALYSLAATHYYTMGLSREFPLILLKVLAYVCIPLTFVLNVWGGAHISLTDIMQNSLFVLPIITDMYILSLQYQEPTND